MALLGSRFELHDIRDVERFAQAIVERQGLGLTPHDRDDVLAYLISESWQHAISGRWQSTRGSFGTFLQPRLLSSVVSWLRKPNERTGRSSFRSASVSTAPTASYSASQIDWSTLSPEAAWTMTEIALPISCGLSETQAARRLGTSVKFVRDCLGELRDELTGD